MMVQASVFCSYVIGNETFPFMKVEILY